MYDPHITNALIIIIVFLLMFYIIPALICLAITVTAIVRSIFRDLNISIYSDTYVYPMNVGDFIKKCTLSIVPIINILLIIDFISKYAFYRKFGACIRNILESEPHISFFKKKK